MAGRKSALDKGLVIELFKSGHTYRSIAEHLNSNEDTIRMIIKRNTSEDDLSINKAVKEEKKKQVAREKILHKENEDNSFDFIVEYTHKLDAVALAEIKEANRYGINTNESMSKKALIKACFHSYKTDSKTGRVKFDTSRGVRTKDVPASYMPGEDFKNTYNCHCLALASGGINITKEFRIKAYDSFDAEVRARKKINRLISTEFKIRFLTVSEVVEIEG